MIPVSARFLAALRGDHAISASAYLAPPGTAWPGIPVAIIGGTLTVDVDAQIRRQAELEIAFSLADPATVDIVRNLPFGGYCRIFRGIRFADGSVERCLMGTFRVDAVSWPELQGTASLTLNDRMGQIIDEALQVPYVASGQKPSNAIVALVQQVFGGTIAYHVSTTPASEPTLTDVVYEEDRAAAISDLAAGISAAAYFDYLGDFVLKPLAAAPPPVADWVIDSGENGVLVSALESLDRSAVRNGVAVRAQADPATPPLYSLATDTDPDSPTRWGGPFGHVPLIVNSSSIQTQAAADSTAASLLRLRLGLSRTLELRTVPNPALEGGDYLEIRHPDGRTETAYANGFSLDMAPEGEFAIWTRTNWRPDLRAAEVPRRRVRMFRGVEALRELEGVPQ